MPGDIIQRLNRTFVTPIDREDIYALAKSLDDVMDAVDAAAGVVRRYRIEVMPYGARELAALIWRSTMQVKVAVEALEKKAGVHDPTVEINRLENAADTVHDEALRRLFEHEKDAIHLIKCKEMLDLLEVRLRSPSTSGGEERFSLYVAITSMRACSRRTRRGPRPRRRRSRPGASRARTSPTAARRDR